MFAVSLASQGKGLLLACSAHIVLTKINDDSGKLSVCKEYGVYRVAIQAVYIGARQLLLIVYIAVARFQYHVRIAFRCRKQRFCVD